MTPQKPITVAREEYLQSIIKLSNETPLPAFAKIDALNGVINSLQQIAVQEYQQEKDAWEKAQSDTEDKEK